MTKNRIDRWIESELLGSHTQMFGGGGRFMHEIGTSWGKIAF